MEGLVGRCPSSPSLTGMRSGIRARPIAWFSCATGWVEAIGHPCSAGQRTTARRSSALSRRAGAAGGKRLGRVSATLARWTSAACWAGGRRSSAPHRPQGRGRLRDGCPEVPERRDAAPLPAGSWKHGVDGLVQAPGDRADNHRDPREAAIQKPRRPGGQPSASSRGPPSQPKPARSPWALPPGAIPHARLSTRSSSRPFRDCGIKPDRRERAGERPGAKGLDPLIEPRTERRPCRRPTSRHPPRRAQLFPLARTDLQNRDRLDDGHEDLLTAPAGLETARAIAPGAELGYLPKARPESRFPSRSRRGLAWRQGSTKVPASGVTPPPGKAIRRYATR
jgi:hypothetical protein